MSSMTEPPSKTEEKSHSGERHSRRRRQAVFFDLTETADVRFDRVIEYLLMALLAFSPLAIGGVQAWSELVVIIIAALMSLCLAAKLISRTDVRFIWSWTYLPILGFLLLTIFQLIPLPVSILHLISPSTVELKQSLLAHVPNMAGTVRSMTLTLYPEATWQNFRMLLAVSAIFVVTLNTIRQQQQIERLLLVIALIGAVIAVIGFGHLAFRAEHVYGLYGTLRASWPIAPFINHNHFGQFMNLSLGAGLALLLGQVEQLIRNRRRSSTSEGDILGLVSGTLWAVGISVIIIAVGAFLSLSRGTMIGLVLGGMISMIATPKQGVTTRIWLLAPVTLLVVMAVIFFGFDEVVGRFQDGDSVGMDQGGRIEIVQDSFQGWKHFPIFGTGLGSFETFFPSIDQSSILSVATHAEDEFIQVLLEGGIIGLAMVCWFLGIVTVSYLRCLKSAPSMIASMAPGLAFAILAIVIQSFSDFGQHAPANAILTAVICSLLVTLAEASRRTTAITETASRPIARPVRIAAAIGMGIVFISVIAQGYSVARAERAWFSRRELDERLQDRNWRGSNEEYATLLLATDAAAKERPGDIHYQYWLNFYRWKSISRDRDPQTGQIRLTPQQIRWAEQIALELLKATPACPTFGPPYLLAGEIDRKILDKQEVGAAEIREGYRLSRTDPAANFEAALLDAEAGQWDAALGKMRHAAALMSPYLNESVDVLTRDFHRPDLAIQLAGSDVAAMRRIEGLLDKSGDTETLPKLRATLAEMIESAAEDKNASAQALVEAARLAASQKNYDTAIKYYQRAFQIDYAQADWRLELARVLAENGNLTEAMSEAHTADRLGAGGAQQLLLELRLRPATLPTAAPNQ